MPPTGGYEVDRVPLACSYFTPEGNRKDVFFVLWRGFPQSAGTWEPLDNFNEATLVQDIGPLLAQLRVDGRAELQQHHDCTLLGLQRAIAHALKKRQGDGVLDRGVRALARVETLTYARLFGERLGLLAQACRSGRPDCRTFAFVTTTMFYDKVFPKTRLQRLAHSVGSGRQQQRRILAVMARVREGHDHAGETVFVLTTKKSYLRVQNRVISTRHEQLDMRIECTVRYSTRSVAPRNNLMIRGALLALNAREWAKVHKYLPQW